MTIIWAGLAVGSVYALVALILNLTYSSSGVLNLAAPQFMMVGAFIGYVMVSQLHASFALAVLISAVLGGVLGFLEDRAAIRPLRGRLGHTPLVTTLGASVVIQGIAYLIWGGAVYTVPFPLGTASLTLLGGKILPVDIVLIAIAVIATVVLHLAVNRTRIGLAARASTLDVDAARLRGVNVSGVITVSFVAAGAVGAAVGPVVGAKLSATTDLGLSLLLLGFLAACLGGLGSYVGALVGGLFVGLVQLLVSRYLGSDFPLLVLYAVLLIVLLSRPAGLFGGRRLRDV